MKLFTRKASLLATVGLISLSLGVAQARPTVLSQPWGATPDGQAVRIVTLKNDHNVTARVITYGGIIQSVETPNREGKLQDVVLGFNNLNGYTQDSAKGGLYFGAIIGRYANRIAKGTYSIDGKVYHAAITAGPNAMHGGKKGFDKNVWTIEKTGVTEDGAFVTLKLVSPNGDQGFPGTLTTHVTYSLNNDNAFSLHYVATTDAPTVLNLTNHSYWNLNGEGSGTIEPEILQVNADRFTPTDSTSIPTGEIAPVAGTPLDFTKPTAIGDRLRSNNQQMLYARGYDMNWVVNGEYGKEPRLAGKVYDPRSGRGMEILTNQPGLQVYTSNSLDGTYAGVSGHTYRQTDAVAFEAEHYPDSPNHPSFPTTELKPGQTFDYTTTYRFTNK
ncbi:aldose epimerase family protein [Swingsia samuiensis]|uniref:Aldose 1-epimerase n=1 Tax=Swingsia samuiensis TaxID=1293412 RepID=A0A4Y6UL16_9PROT|nr:aldose epimerase family protein [Swingsia samuiensis]QDH17091.1 galactose mutarotase [Swingsia samuiensis]